MLSLLYLPLEGGGRPREARAGGGEFFSNVVPVHPTPAHVCDMRRPSPSRGG